MNLLDYQKSGNALGSKTAPQPVFNPLTGLIPNIPDIKSIMTYNITDLTAYTKEFYYDPQYLQSAFGYRYDLVTTNGVARYLSDIPNPYALYEDHFYSSYDPFRQAIGSYPDAPSIKYTGYVGSGEEFLQSLQTAGLYYYGKQYQLAGFSKMAKYKPYALYPLPSLYKQNVHFDKMRFTGVAPYAGSSGPNTEAENTLFPTENMPLQAPSSVVHLPNPSLSVFTPFEDQRVAYNDPVGQNYKIFSFRKEQYIYLFGTIPTPFGAPKVGSKPQPLLIDSAEEYQIYCDAVKLNFMSMFASVLDKKEGIFYPYEGINPNIPGSPFKAIKFEGPTGNESVYDHDQPIFEFSAGTFTQNMSEFYNLLSVVNPVSNDPLAAYVYDGSAMAQITRTINRFAFHVFKNIENTVYSDVSFDVEPDVLNEAYAPPTNPPTGMTQGGPGTLAGAIGEGLDGVTTPDPGFVRTSFPGGIPVNMQKLTESKTFGGLSDMPAKILTANVTSVYNYLSTDWENVLQNIPETAIPPIFISQPQFEGVEGVFPTQDQLISKGKNSYAFTLLWEQATKCKSYKELNDYATKKGYGKHSKIIYVPNEKYLQDIEEAKINYPMYNEIEFDIYSNANSKITNSFRKFGISKSILGCLMSHLYGPLSQVEYIADITPEGETAADFLSMIANGDTEAQEAYDSMLFKFNKAIESGVFNSLSGKQEKISYIFKALGLKPKDKLAENLFPNLPDAFRQVVTMNLEKFYQYYVANNSTKQADQPPEDFEGVDGFQLKNPESYADYYSQFGPEDVSSLTGVVEDSAESYAIGMSSVVPVHRQIQDKMPNINEILSHKPRYSEPFMYEIEKIVDGSVIQRIFIPHFADPSSVKSDLKAEPEEPKIKRIKYIDTQVKYGELYTYNIKQHRIVIGGDYRFVFSSNHDTHRRASALGYPERYESDIIMKAGRNTHVEGEMVYDAVTPPGEGFTPVVSAIQPFMFYTKQPDQFAVSTGEEIAIDKITVGANKPMDGELPDINADAPKNFDRLDKLAIFKSMVYPNFRLTTVPYYKQMALVADFPPLPPNVNFEPQVGKGSTILMTFEHQVGDREEVPIIVNDYDEVLFMYQRIAQNREDKEQNGVFRVPQIRFKTDDFPKAYQIFVMDKKPISYASFKDKLALELSVETATAIKQPLVPNKKYYFMFRTVDIHGNISNPSIVYEVEMVFNSGVYYPIVNEYEFEKGSNGEKFKPFKRYAKIEAALIQRIVNRDASGISQETSTLNTAEKPVLGIAPHSLWNEKKFKFRIISKHTGKVIDMNVKFKTNYTESEIKGC
jgi:hypothetical protein